MLRLYGPLHRVASLVGLSHSQSLCGRGQVQLDWLSMSSRAYVGIRAVDIRFQFQIQIRNPDENYTDIFNLFLVKQELSFWIFLLVLYGVIVFSSFLMFCINYGGVDVVSWQIGPRWWQTRTF